MAELADLHIHSCLSPCADDDMTPANICGMAKLKGLEIIAVTDHNSAANLPYVQACAQAYGLLLIPGMEITTKEEVHLLGYFQTVQAAVSFGEFVRPHLPQKINRPSLFGNQYVCDDDDQVLSKEDALLIGATDLTLSELTEEIRKQGGVPVPAHINRGSNGLLVNLGMMPENLSFTAVEVWKDLPCPHSPQSGKIILHSSDAHHLGDIFEPTDAMTLKNINSVNDFLNYLRNNI